MSAVDRSFRRQAKLRRRTVAGLSALAVSGLFTTYLQALRSPSAYATTNCTVTVGTDNAISPPAGSLRACINAVESGGGGAITFSVSTVTLATELPPTHVSFSLDGGANGVTINGGGTGSDFRFLKPYLDHRTLDISHVTFQNFDGTSDKGGVLYIMDSYATLNLTDVTGQDNYNSNQGGFLYWDNDELTINVTDSNFARNESGDAGGVFYFDDGGEINITRTTFTDNVAATDGGVLYVDSDNTTITDSTFTGNQADYGGALWLDGAVITITGSDFENNSASSKAGVAYIYDPDNMIVTDSTFKNNSTTDHASVFYDEASDPITITGSVFEGNTASSFGGTVYGFSPVNITDTSFIDNTATYGAAIYDVGDTYLTNVSFVGNSVSATGGAIYGADSLTGSNVTFANNTAGGDGAATFNTGVTTLTNTTFTGNTSTAGDIVHSDDSTTFNFVTIAANNVQAGYSTFAQPGGTTLTLNGSVIADATGSACDLNGATVVDQYSIATDTTCSLTGTGSVQSATAADLDFGAAQVKRVRGVDQTVLPMVDTSILATGSAPGDLGTGITTDQVGTTRAAGDFTIGARQYVLPVPPPNAPLTPEILAGNGKVTITVHRGKGGGNPTSFLVTAGPGGRTCTITASTTGTCTINGLTNGTLYTFTAVAINAGGTSGPSSVSEKAQPGAIKKPSPQAIARFLKKGQAVASEGGVPAPITVDANSGQNGVDIEGDNFGMGLDGLKPNGAPMNLGADGVLVLANERDVLTNGVGFMPTSEVDLYVDPEVREVRGRHSVRKPVNAIYVGTVTVRADGTFRGTATLPDGISKGTHDLQAVGVSKGNLLRVMTLGVYVTDKPGPVRNLKVDSTSSSGTADLSWSWPAGSKVAGIDGYRVDYRPAGMSAFLRFDSVADPYDTVTGLVPGCAYVFRVRAVNGAGVGAPAFTDVTYIADGLRARPAGDIACLVK